MRRRRALFGLLVAVGLMLAGCTGQGLPTIARDEASTVGVVAAIRLSPQLHDIDRGASRGYVLLIDKAGHATKLQTRAMDVGHLAWARTGLFFSDEYDEYALSDDGLKTMARGSQEAYETSRFLSPGSAGFIAVYSVGFGDHKYLARVTTGDRTATHSWDLAGMFQAVSQCDGFVFGTTDIKELGPAFDTEEVHTDALVQLYPEPADTKSMVRATLPIPKGGLSTAATDAPCEAGTVYTLAVQSDERDATVNERPVLRAWNTATGKHRVIPLLTAHGAPLDVSVDDLMDRPGRIVAHRYLWADRSNRIFGTDLETGATEVVLRVSMSSPEMGESQFVFTDSSVYVLDVGQNTKAPLDLSRYDLASGKRTKLLSVRGTGSIHDGLNMVIRDLALNPEWVTTTEASSAPETRRTSGVRR